MDDLSLWYDKPAPKWLSALPVGNGRLDAKVFGRVRKEWIQLNEETLWTRNRESRLNPAARENLSEMQRLLMDGRVREAQYLAENAMFGTPTGLTTYETLSNLVLLFADQYDEDARDYRRDLDLATGIATVRFSIGGTHFTREIFASGPADAVIIRLTADRPAALNFSAAFWRPYDNNYRSFPVAPDLLSLKGQCGVQGVRYETLVKVVTEGGSVAATGDHLVIKDADAVTITVNCASDFRHADFGAAARAAVEKAAARRYSDLRAEHIADHQSRFGRFRLDIVLPPDQVALRTMPILGIDTDFATRLKDLLPKLPPTQIDGNGRVAEWLDDGDEYEPGHRHNSHLFGLYPDDQITPEATPDLALAARRSLEWRIANGGAGPCWSRAWICGLWARLGDGEEMHVHLNAFIRESTDLNMFSMHPPQGSNPNHVFQIDGNLGFTAAVAEAVVQSQAGRLKLLPAVPSAWPEGNLSGLRARGGFTVGITWREGALVEARITSHCGLPLRIASGDIEVNCTTQVVKARVTAGETVFDTVAGAVYSVRPQRR